MDVVGQDGQRADQRRFLVGPDGVGDILRAHGADAGRTFLDFRDEAKTLRQRIGQRPDGGSIGSHALDFRQRALRLGRSEFGADIEQNIIEDGFHTDSSRKGLITVTLP